MRLRKRRALAWLLCAFAVAVAATADPNAGDDSGGELLKRRDLATPRWRRNTPPKQRVRFETPLEQAAASSSLAATTALLAQGADPNAPGWEGVTALHAAATSR